jgi:hypothetical protein
VDLQKRQALSTFYREEFERHIEHLQAQGLVVEGAVVDRACRRFMANIDHVCGRAEFSALAETLLRSFDTLTRLSEFQPRQGH